LLIAALKHFARMKKLLVSTLLAVALTACGGGGSSNFVSAATAATAAPQRLVGEIVATPAQVTNGDLATNAGFAGNLPASYAIQAAGKAQMLDLQFVRGAGGEAQLVEYAKQNTSLLTPGVRVLVADELFWNPDSAAPDSDATLQPQLAAFADAVALVRKYVPQARVGVTITPYAMIGHPNSLEYAKRALALVDWVGTDAYWLGGDNVQALEDWSRTFNATAKQANPRVETWFIAQAFKMPAWDTATFNAFTQQQLATAESYDAILFFGWQFVSEIDISAAGMNFPAATRAMFSKYLKAR
jgi:hypothetical protein